MSLREKQTLKIQPIEIKTPEGTQTVDTIWFNGYEPTIKLVFSNEKTEYELICTFNHTLRTVDGVWIQAEEIDETHLFDGGFRLKYSSYLGDEIPTFDISVPTEECYILESGIVSHNTSSLVGGISEGINPDPAMVFTQKTAAGETDRINPTLLQIMKDRGVYTKKHLKEVTEKFGSVQHVDWLTPEEKEVFKTAFEIDQMAVVRMAAARGKFIDQWQSLNLFFGAEENPERIAKVHQYAFENPDILGLYYIYTQAGLGAAKETECVACQ